ncbi:MAG: hypothetical protein GXY83_37840 [Rhodopirellula sp.]|nr:hypothetical protein [Rhodopirellula sp.]
MPEAIPRFDLGQVVATPAALGALHKARQSPTEFVLRHAAGDWGNVCEEDRRLNEEAISNGSQIVSCYRTRTRVAIWVITDGADERGKRHATTVLLPDEY